jgi:carbamoyl-phosphate synthase large subunit
MTKPQKVLIIGSGPIVIGQAAEFDYSGSQACQSLREEGVHTVLVNSNPATIMTDDGIADTIYIEPLTVDVISRIVERERPDGLLPTLGGQTGLNLAVALADAGVLEKYNVRMLGTPLATIRAAEDRELFKQLLDEARRVAGEIGLPIVVRPAYTLGGTGGGIAYSNDELDQIVSGGLAASPINQVLIERYLEGWKEIEYEVMRDSADNCVTICNMENIDPMGVHTGDSIVVAPSQTLSDKEFQMLRSASLKIIRALGIEGGCNVQYALAPRREIADWDLRPDGRPPYYVIEVNPRVSRSSALASKATGYPIARVASKIAVGKTLDEIPNRVTGKTTAAFEPALDYVVVKIPRWPFDKFPLGERRIGTQMKATGEVMAIDRTFEAALGKAIRSLEFGGRSLLWEDPAWRDIDPRDYVSFPTDERLWALLASLRRGAAIDELSKMSGVDPWFLHKMSGMIDMERRLLAEPLTPDLLRDAKRKGLSDRVIGTLADRLPEQVRALRLEWGVIPVYKMVDTCAAEFEAETPYFYSTYDDENEATPAPGRKALVIGSGPIRIGQGIEFDYSAVHAAWALQGEGVSAIIANSNPETVSTDFDTSNRLYFEPLDEEAVRDLLENETVDGYEPSAIVQFGGQTAINLATPLAHANHPILGSSADAIDIAEDRSRFENLLQELGIPQPPGAAVQTIEEALQTAQLIGYPVLVRPSYVLGGRAMEIVQNPTDLIRYVTEAADIAQGKPILIDKYLEGIEAEVDGICDGTETLIPGVMQHIERAGVHSGDSMAVYPPVDLTDHEVASMVDYTQRMAAALGVKGLMNVQYVIMRPESGEPGESRVYVLEVNPRASRTVPFISKVTDVPMVKLAVQVMLGKTLRELGYQPGLWPEQDLVSVKAPVFSMSKLIGVDTHLGPEMKSTGEVMGVDHTFEAALAKALQAADMALPKQGAILLSLADHTKAEAMPLVRSLTQAGYRIYATEGTATMIKALGLPVERVPKRIEQGHPNVVDVIQEGLVDAVINTPEGRITETLRDGFDIRRAAAEKRIPCLTSIDTAAFAIHALVSQDPHYTIQPLRHYLRPSA